MSNWFQSAAPLEDGWYWRKEIDSNFLPVISEVGGGTMLDMELTDCGKAQENTCILFQNSDFQDYWFNGPIEVPE